MIIALLKGGLGNQMFQYAFGRFLSLKNKTPLKLDLSFLKDRSHKDNFTYRDFELDRFNIEVSIASENEIRKFEKAKQKKKLSHMAFYFPVPFINAYLREPHFHFFQQALNAPENSYIDGYWQSEKYFYKIRERLINEFTPLKPLSAQSENLKNEIISNQSVSIHVRRTDYVTDRIISSYHSACSEKYYYDAIKIIEQKISNPKFYIFSDELEWFQNNVKINFPVEYVKNNTGLSSYQDQHLMSLCKHNIIANSSFSWWAAWLNANSGKTIIAPENWFVDKSRITSDLLPESWIKI
jgi:hypothetical protein